MWALDSNDFSGVNDRYFIMQRSAAGVMESFMDQLNSFDSLEP